MGEKWKGGGGGVGGLILRRILAGTEKHSQGQEISIAKGVDSNIYLIVML